MGKIEKKEKKITLRLKKHCQHADPSTHDAQMRKALILDLQDEEDATQDVFCRPTQPPERLMDYGKNQLDRSFVFPIRFVSFCRLWFTQKLIRNECLNDFLLGTKV